jgi:TonB-dependent SusC/RagA subfamily outer membrane receptor
VRDALEPSRLNAGRTPLQLVEAPMMVLSARPLLAVAVLVTFAGACSRRSSTAPPPSPATASTVTASDIDRVGSGQPLERLLEGRVSGVTVEAAAGGGIAVRIRGSSSFYGGSEPLYVVDGVPFNVGPKGALTGINPYDIESIRVLKNPADVALYGVRGANGVILITMKGSR